MSGAASLQRRCARTFLEQAKPNYFCVMSIKLLRFGASQIKALPGKKNPQTRRLFSKLLYCVRYLGRRQQQDRIEVQCSVKVVTAATGKRESSRKGGFWHFSTGRLHWTACLKIHPGLKDSNLQRFVDMKA